MGPPARCALLLLLLLPASLHAQELRWNLPERGAAIYRRELRVVEQTVDPAGAPLAQSWYGDPNAAVVLAGELDDRKQRSLEPVADPRDLLCALCLDLSHFKAGKARVPVVSNRFAAGELAVVWGAPDATGGQDVEAVFAELELDRVARPRALPKLQATVRGRRVVDRQQGRVVSFAGEIVLQVQHSQPRRTVTSRLSDAWTFEQLLAPADPAFRTMVVEAINKAVAALQRQLDLDLRRTPAAAQDPHHDTQPGSLALTLLALVKGGADPRQPRIERGYAELRARAIEGTYSLAVATLAVEALYTPAGEWQHMREGRLKAPMPRQLTEADQKLVADWTATLLGNIDTTVDAAYLRRWHYGPSNSWDNSNTQYALLGLYGAQLCGAEISPQIWTAAANHWLQCTRGVDAEGVPELTTHAEQQQEEQGKRPTRTRGRKVPELGWAYQQTGEPTGSMTAAGVTGLTICAAALRGQKKGNVRLLQQVDDAARGGFLWLQHNLSVRRNPGPTSSWDSWYYYWLYGLERTCELNQVALLGERDWYFEGALQLLGQQRRDGSWAAGWDTCFALLFLKKAALPVITPR